MQERKSVLNLLPSNGLLPKPITEIKEVGNESVEGVKKPGIKEQRDEARQQRDVARMQRNEARQQRDALRQHVAELEESLRIAIAKAKNPKAPGTMPQPPKAAAFFTDVDFYAGEATRHAAVAEIEAKAAKGVPLLVKEREAIAERIAPPFRRSMPSLTTTPGADVAFLTVANDKFVPGLEAMFLSLLEVYPDFCSDIHVCHDGTLSNFIQRRLTRLYPRISFIVPDMEWFDSVPAVSDNHKRIGKLGYMNIYGLTLDGYRRIVLLDSDLLITGDIAPLWETSKFGVCYDCGAREYAAKSLYTERFVFNSGVISIPGEYATPAYFEEIKEIVRNSAIPVCSIIDRFADQKVWNIFLKDKPTEYLPINFNCNIKYVISSLAGNAEGASVIHFAGPKPWNNKVYIHSDYVTPITSNAAQYPKLWTDKYRQLMYDWRLREFQNYASTHQRKVPLRSDSKFNGRKICVMIGNGPSIERTDLSLIEGYERFCFNWFLLHKEFDNLKPEHLVLASHMFFGGWNIQTPSFPPNFLERLRTCQHRPIIWTSFYFREYLEEIGLHHEFEINYVLFEKPFKRFVDKVGRFNADISGFLDDARTGVMSAAIPAAVSLGFETILLVGCDSSYNNPDTKANYFYDEREHTSLQTNNSSLTSTWTDEGRGQFVYKLALEEMQRRSIEFVDCTVDGRIKFVPKGRLENYIR